MYRHITEPLLEVYKILYGTLILVILILHAYMVVSTFCSWISETAKSYDPESDMTVVVGVPVYYSEENRVMIRLSC